MEKSNDIVPDSPDPLPAAPPSSPDLEFSYNLTIPPSFNFIADPNPDFGESTEPPIREDDESIKMKLA